MRARPEGLVVPQFAGFLFLLCSLTLPCSGLNYHRRRKLAGRSLGAGKAKAKEKAKSKVGGAAAKANPTKTNSTGAPPARLTTTDRRAR